MLINQYYLLIFTGLICCLLVEARTGRLSSSSSAVAKELEAPTDLLKTGAICNKDTLCLSGVCHNWKCAKPRQHSEPKRPVKIAEWGRCHRDSDCYSGYCYESPARPGTKYCSTDGPIPNTISAGGWCLRNSQCYSGVCRSFFASSVCLRDPTEKQKMPEMFPCRQHEDCAHGHCAMVAYIGMEVCSRDRSGV